MVEITLPGNDQIIAAAYLRYLPAQAELRAELMREHELAERQLRLATSHQRAQGEAMIASPCR
jgi:hypothetical protein